MDANKQTPTPPPPPSSQKQGKQNYTTTQDELVEEFNEKATMGTFDDINEKDALRQEHQDDLDDLLNDTPPPSRSDTTSPVSQQQHQQQEAKIGETRNEELQYIFNQFDGKGTEEQDSPATDNEATTPASPTSPTSTSNNEQDRRTSITDLRNANVDKPLPPPVDVPFDFNKFLWQMRRRQANPITKYFKSFLQAFDRRPWAVNEQIKIIQDFLDFIYVKMHECEVWKYSNEQEFENAKEGMEKLVMNRLYHATFTPSTTDDKERDEILQQKISIFRWIREKHLDITETEHNESFMTFAESELLKINNYKAPRDKLICILNCCKVIFGLMKHVDDGEGGADKFLPLLIYVVIRANPPRLVSNVQYISRFRNPQHLQAEAGYYLTNLMGAISFIETMEAKSLSITQEEFDGNIERTMLELKQERPNVTQDKQKINYENAVHPSHSSQSIPSLMDPAKAANFLEKGSTFAQKTMQKPLNFVGKIFQGLGEGGQDDDQQQYYQQQQQQQQLLHQQQQQQQQQQQHYYQHTNPTMPSLPPRPPIPQGPDPRQIFDDNLKTIITMFPNVEPDVCYMILQANENDVDRSVDTLLEISDTSGPSPHNIDTTQEHAVDTTTMPTANVSTTNHGSTP
ncbi:hypothetical protein BC941DRAFT_515460 [Chlamydoabsidia padenii]|nr:hypothetical protein BC941DRAFT_515460 [Chlamydoabsidia padenii]